MSTIILAQDTPTKIECAGKLFKLYEGDDGTLYIEADNSLTLEVAISDDGDEQIKALGTWLNIGILAQEETGGASSEGVDCPHGVFATTGCAGCSCAQRVARSL